MTDIQYRVVVAKKDERTAGPDDAPTVMTVPLAEASADDFDPAVAFMRGKLKASGPSKRILEALENGEAAHQIAAVVADIDD